VQFPPGNSVAPAGSYRSGGGGHETVGAFENWRDRAECYQELADWTKAADDWEQALGIELGQGRSVSLNDRSRLATVYLAAKDVASYCRICGQLLHEYRHTDDADETIWVTGTCCLMPDAVEELDKVVKLAERGLALRPKDADLAENLGSALYRAGKYHGAADQLRAAISPHAEGGSTWMHLFLAMTYRRMGQAEDARASLNRAIERIRSEERGAAAPGEPASRLDVVERAYIRCLRCEAEELIMPTGR
jgi:tetratricopeptide (TPR) repeat protein